jgi:hypothetical protein
MHATFAVAFTSLSVLVDGVVSEPLESSTGAVSEDFCARAVITLHAGARLELAITTEGGVVLAPGESQLWLTAIRVGD